MYLTDTIANYVESLFDEESGGYRSVEDLPVTAYGTCYALLTLHYVGITPPKLDQSLNYLTQLQNARTGWFEGPELAHHTNRRHDRNHLLCHLSCTVLPVLEQFKASPKHRLFEAEKLLDQDFLGRQLEAANLKDAWFEGNNLLFMAQLLLHLNNLSPDCRVSALLEQWKHWHDQRIDPKTGLWGTDRGCSVPHAIFGAYHQFIIYNALGYPLSFKRELVDNVLSIQHADGGFAATAGGGACEDVDSVDILVNIYKRINYRRQDIQESLRRCRRLISSCQNADGGFAYKRNQPSIHMGISATRTGAGQSSMFPTWFRTHTLALIDEVLGCKEPPPRKYSDSISMGWHKTWLSEIGHPPVQAELPPRVSLKYKIELLRSRVRFGCEIAKGWTRTPLRILRKQVRRLWGA